MTEQELKGMKLHDEVKIADCCILRVYGGWIYEFSNGCGVFVPEKVKVHEKIYE